MQQTIPQQTTQPDMFPSLWAEVAESNGQAFHVNLWGELDLSSKRVIIDVISRVEGSTVEVNLSNLTFIDAAGIRSLLEAKQRLAERGHSLVITGARGLVRRVFEILDLDEFFGPEFSSSSQTAADVG